MIEFSTPAALWLLTLSIPLILLYLLKRRRREMVISSTMLWKQALEDIRAETPFQKLRSSLLLLLQLLILVLITAILSGPHLVAQASLSRRWILVLDCSASMRATDVKPSRFSVAKEKLLNIIKQIPDQDQALLLAFSSETIVVQPFTNDLAQIHQKIEALQPEDVGSDWRQLVKILEPLTRDKLLPSVIVASDFANLPPGLFSAISLDAVAVGSSNENVGITRATCKVLPGLQGRQLLLYQIANFSSAAMKRNITLYVDDSVMDSFDVALTPSETMERTTELEVQQTSKVRIESKPHDKFSLDDDFVLIVEKPAPVFVNLNYKNSYLVKALQILPNVKISPTSPIAIEKISDLAQAEHSGIYFVQADPSSPAAATVHWNEAHSVMRFVDGSAWRFRHVAPLIATAGSELLIEIADGTIGYAVTKDSERKIILGFALEDSNLPSLAGFPVFLQNAISWIQEGSEKPMVTTTGRRFRKEGPYEVDGRQGFANFADSGESNIQSKPPASKSGSGASFVPRKKDVASWFLLLATGIVIVEWWAFHRRIDA